MLHQVVAEHLEAFLGAVAAADAGAGLPQFVEREFGDLVLKVPRPKPQIAERTAVCAACS